MTKSRGIHTPRKRWTELELSLLTVLYPSTFSATLANFFKCPIHVVYNKANKLELKKTKWYQDTPMAQRLRRGDETGKAHRFPKGHVPANKGIKGINYPGMQATQFKPGTKPSNHKPVGSTRISDGYVYIKMAEGMFQFKLLHRVIWERMNGPIPPGYLLAFIDRNKENCRITNLTLMSKKENVLRNGIHSYGPEIAQLYQLKGAVTRQINKRKRDENHE